MNEGIEIPITAPGASSTEAQLTRLTAALEALAGRGLRKVDQESKAAESSWSKFAAGAGRASNVFNETREAVTAIAERLHGAAQSIAELAGEQQQLDRVQRTLNLSFEEAQQAAGRYTSQIDIMRFSTFAANRGLVLSQQELNNLSRVAVAHAQARGQDVKEVFENMVDGIVEGDESLEKLDGRFKALAGDTHTAAERLRELMTFARGVAPAADDARTSMERFEGSVRQLGREASRTFVEEFARLQEIPDEVNDARARTVEWNEALKWVAETVAVIASVSVNSIAFVGGVLATAVGSAIQIGRAGATAIGALYDGVRSGDIAGAVSRSGQVFLQSLEANMNSPAMRRIMEFTENRGTTALDNLLGGPRGSSDPNNAADMTFTAADVAADQRNQETRNRLNRAARRGSAGARQDTTADAIRRAREENERAARFRRGEGDGEDFLGFASAARERAAKDERDRQARTAREAFQREREADAQARERDAERATAGGRFRTYFEEQASSAQSMAAAVTSAYEQMTAAASSHFEALVLGQETAGEALQGFVSDTLKALAKIAAQQAIFELGKGFAALFLNPAEAAAHFGAAALFGVVAAGAGLAAQAVAPSDKGRAAGGSSGGSRDREAANVSGRSSSQGGTQVINVMFGGPMYGTGGVRQAGRELAGVLNRGAVQGGTLLNPLLVPQG